MATTTKPLYGTNNQAITLTLNALTASLTVGRASTAVDNTGNLFDDALVVVQIKMPAAGSPANSKAVWVYAYATADGGATYTDGATGSDAGFTRTDPANLPLLGVVNCVANTTTYRAGPWSVASVFGGTLPDHWGIACFNDTGLTLFADTNSKAWYQGVQFQNV